MLKIIRRLFILVIALIVGYKSFITYQAIDNVLEYRSLVEEVLSEDGNTTNVDLILAVIYTETKGEEVDLMQSSESESGVANTISDSRTSIKQGATVLASNLAEAAQAGTDTWTAVQAYNFGSAYIDYVAENGGENTIKLAKAYSRDVVAPSLGNSSGETYQYYNPIALLYGGGRLYVNGGNIYYAKQVQFNYFLIRIVDSFRK